MTETVCHRGLRPWSVVVVVVVVEAMMTTHKAYDLHHHPRRFLYAVHVSLLMLDHLPVAL
jgi:EamA domain-containing membrane protein RarD